MQGWRTEMEDAHIANIELDEQKSALFGVYDGHGGKEVAKFVSRHLAEELVRLPAYHENKQGDALQLSYLRIDDMLWKEENRQELMELATPERGEPSSGPRARGIFEDESMKRRLKVAVRARARMNGSLNTPYEQEFGGPTTNHDDASEPLSPGTTAGCTAVTAFVRGDQLVVANSGDSRGVLCRGGRSIALSKDHKPTDEPENRRITRAGGYVVDGRINGSLNLSRAIGDLEYKESRHLPPQEQIVTAWPEVKHVKLEKGDDFMILACDGIWDVLSNQAACDFVKRNLVKTPRPSLSKIASDMCDHCLAKDTNNKGLGCDNMSVVIVRFKKL